jgi:predicted MFS family arabinose efflux permease
VTAKRVVPPVAGAPSDVDTTDEKTPSTFASLSVRPYRTLWSAGIIVFFAVQAQQIARGALAHDLTGSNAGLGGVFFGFGFPMLFLTPFGGVAADRLPKRLVMICAQGFLVAGALWVGIAQLTDSLEYWMLVGASVLQGVGFSVYGPTRVAFTGELVPKALIGNAVVLTQMGLNSTRVFAPAIAGALIGIETIGTEGVYLATACLMVVALFITFRLPNRPPAEDRPDRSVIAELVDGVRYARADPMIALLIMSAFVMVMIGWQYLTFLPAVADDLFDAGSSGYGTLSSASAVGAVAVTIWIARISRPSQLFRIQTIAGIALAFGLFAIALAPTFGMAVLALVLIGGAASAYQSMNNTLVLTLADLEYHGRVQSLLMLSFSGFGMAGLPLGALADKIGLRETFFGMGLICLVTMLVYALLRSRALARTGDDDLEVAPA